MNFANRKVADFMDMTPEDIARQRHHQDIVELLTGNKNDNNAKRKRK